MLREKLELGRREYPEVAGAVFAYLFKRISMRELSPYLGDKKKKAHIRRVLADNGYILRNCKLYAHAFWEARNSGGSVHPSDFEIEKSDLSLLKRLNLDHLKDTCAPMTIRDMEHTVELATFSPEISEYMGRFISKKMSFLIKHYGVKRADLEVLMRTAVVRGIYKQYPFIKSDLHVCNLSRTILKNTGHTLILYHTRASRNQLQPGLNGQNEAKLVPLDNLNVAYEPSEVKSTLETLVELSPKLGQKPKRFLLLSAGQYDPEFSAYLKRDNREAIEKMPYPQYLERLQNFIGVSNDQVKALFNWLRPQL